jgi:hypothetical protein
MDMFDETPQYSTVNSKVVEIDFSAACAVTPTDYYSKESIQRRLCFEWEREEEILFHLWVHRIIAVRWTDRPTSTTQQPFIVQYGGTRRSFFLLSDPNQVSSATGVYMLDAPCFALSPPPSPTEAVIPTLVTSVGSSKPDTMPESTVSSQGNESLASIGLSSPQCDEPVFSVDELEEVEYNRPVLYAKEYSDSVARQREEENDFIYRTVQEAVHRYLSDENAVLNMFNTTADAARPASSLSEYELQSFDTDEHSIAGHTVPFDTGQTETTGYTGLLSYQELLYIKKALYLYGTICDDTVLDDVVLYKTVSSDITLFVPCETLSEHRSKSTRTICVHLAYWCFIAYLQLVATYRTLSSGWSHGLNGWSMPGPGPPVTSYVNLDYGQ